MKLKRLSIALSVALLTLTMCKNSNSIAMRGGEDLKTEIVNFKDSLDFKGNVEIEIDYPTENTFLGRSIREWIGDELYIFAQGWENDTTCTNTEIYHRQTIDGRDEIAFYGKATLNNLPIWEDTLFHSFKSIKISKLYETDKIVSYTIEKDIYYAGAAHGITPNYGVTFRKSDGKKIDKYFVTALPQEVLRQALIEYSDMLFRDNEFIAMPLNPPFFTKEGLTFIYQQYEIAPYVAGLPEFTLPYSEVAEYLIPSVRCLANEDDTQEIQKTTLRQD